MWSWRRRTHLASHVPPRRRLALPCRPWPARHGRAASGDLNAWHGREPSVGGCSQEAGRRDSWASHLRRPGHVLGGGAVEVGGLLERLVPLGQHKLLHRPSDALALQSTCLKALKRCSPQSLLGRWLRSFGPACSCFACPEQPGTPPMPFSFRAQSSSPQLTSSLDSSPPRVTTAGRALGASWEGRGAAAGVAAG